MWYDSDVSLLESVGQVHNSGEILGWLERLVGDRLSEDDVENINRWAEDTTNKYYYDINGGILAEDASDDAKKFLFVRSPYCERNTDNELFFVFSRFGYSWVGAYVGDFQFLMNKVQEKYGSGADVIGFDFSKPKNVYIAPPKRTEIDLKLQAAVAEVQKTIEVLEKKTKGRVKGSGKTKEKTKSKETKTTVKTAEKTAKAVRAGAKSKQAEEDKAVAVEQEVVETKETVTTAHEEVVKAVEVVGEQVEKVENSAEIGDISGGIVENSVESVENSDEKPSETKKKRGNSAASASSIPKSLQRAREKAGIVVEADTMGDQSVKFRELTAEVPPMVATPKPVETYTGVVEGDGDDEVYELSEEFEYWVGSGGVFWDKLAKSMLIQNGLTEQSARLRGHIKFIAIRILKQSEAGVKGMTKYVRWNADKTQFLFNTGLLNNFGHPLYFTAKKVLRAGGEITLAEMRMVQNKTKLIAEGFSKKDVTADLLRIPFYDNEKQLVFNAEFEDFDFMDYRKFEHCINERRNRFPKRYQDAPTRFIADDMIKAVKDAIAVSKYDKGYIRPLYDVACNSMGYGIPYFIGGDYSKDADLYIVVRKNGEFWQLGTILPSEIVKVNLTVIYPYSIYMF